MKFYEQLKKPFNVIIWKELQEPLSYNIATAKLSYTYVIIALLTSLYYAL